MIRANGWNCAPATARRKLTGNGPESARRKACWASRVGRADLGRRGGLVALLGVPLIFAGQAIGALSVYTGRAYKFSDEEIRILSALAELSALAIEKARLYERIVDVEEQLRQN